MAATSHGNEPERSLTRRELRELERRREREQAREQAREPEREQEGEPEREPEREQERQQQEREQERARGEQSSVASEPDAFEAILGNTETSLGQERDEREDRAGERSTPRRRGRWGCAIVALVLVAALIAGALFVWNQFGDRVTEFFTVTETDYEGSGNGTEVQFTILSGDTGTTIGQRLQEEGVVLTSEAFVNSIMAMPEEPVFLPGTYAVQEEMSAASALVALTDEENRVQSSVTIPEGTIMREVFTRVEASTGISVAELEAAAADPQQFGLPEEAESLEGFLFPATYDFAPDDTAETILTTMVDRTYESLAAHGVPEDEVWEVIRLASLIEKEARFDEDFYKVSRVFLNRIEIGMLLQSDATVTYGTGEYDRASTTDAERGDASNEYNTYQHGGLVIRPISNPGDLAIDAAMNPADGAWLYFVTVNLETGETVFTETYEEHLEAVDQWLLWLEENPDYA